MRNLIELITYEPKEKGSSLRNLFLKILGIKSNK